MERQMRTGTTEGYCYIAFQPPLTESEFEKLPVPINQPSKPDTPIMLDWNNIEEDDGSQTIGICCGHFGPEESFDEYSDKVAKSLGRLMAGPNIEYLRSGSLFSERFAEAA